MNILREYINIVSKQYLTENIADIEHKIQSLLLGIDKKYMDSFAFFTPDNNGEGKDLPHLFQLGCLLHQ